MKATQRRQTMWHNESTKLCSFTLGNNVLALNFGSGPKWLPGKVMDSRGPVSVTVLLSDGQSTMAIFYLGVLQRLKVQLKGKTKQQ